MNTVTTALIQLACSGPQGALEARGLVAMSRDLPTCGTTPGTWMTVDSRGENGASDGTRTERGKGGSASGPPLHRRPQAAWAVEAPPTGGKRSGTAGGRVECGHRWQHQGPPCGLNGLHSRQWALDHGQRCHVGHWMRVAPVYLVVPTGQCQP